MSKTTKYLLYAAIVFFVLLTVFKSLYLTNKNGGSDLRIRVVASRILKTDQSPYFYKWSPADGEYLLDPNDYAERLVNGNVVTPAVLYLIYPISWQSYPTVRVLWTLVQFLLALLALVLLVKSRRDQWAFLAGSIVLLGIVCSDIWLLNIDRGQVYIFYTFLFASSYRLYTSPLKYGMLMSGFIAGIFIFFRPFAAVLALVFLLNGKKKWLAGYIMGLIIGCFLFVLPQPTLWKDYFKAMNEYGNEYTGKTHLLSTATEYEKPAIIEGVSNLRKAQELNISGLDTVYSYLKKTGIIITKNQAYFVYVVLAILFFLSFFKIHGKQKTPESLFLFAFVLYILPEFFVMAPRNPYNLIQWIFPLTLILLQIRFNQTSFVLLIFGLLLLHNFPFVVPYQAALAELLFIGITIYYSLFIKAERNLQQQAVIN